ncbi:MAG: RHS repeat-associated core domain-containing protein [Limisphaerales bacterium]
MNLHDTIARLTGTVLKRSPLANLDLRRHGYNQAGQRTNQTRLYGDYVTYTYDNAGQLKTAQAKESGGSPSRLQEQFGYLHDAAGNLAFRTNNALTEAFAVNAVNELATALPSGTLTVAGGTLPSATNVTIAGNAAVAAALYHNGTWALPGAALPSGAATYVATARGSQGVQATASVSVFLPPSVTYGYDPNGNLTNDGNRSFTYDDENRLASVWVANVWRADFVYDGKMRLRERFESVWAGGTRMTNAVTFYVYDGNVVVQERNANNLPAVTYTRGLDLGGSLQGAGGVGGLLARTDNSVLATQPLAAHAYYHADGNGNITCLINSSNAVMARYLYDPFGRILSQSGSLAAANLYRFSSKEFHVNSGMYYYLYRFYDSSLQRWLNTDPLEEAGGLNLYGFVANNPTTRSDPLGLLSPACARAMQELANASANFGAAPVPLTSYALNEAIDAAVAACGPDLPPMPPPQPFPKPYGPVCGPGGYRYPPGHPPPQHQSYCDRHPAVCRAGVAVGAGLVAAGVVVIILSTGGTGGLALAAGAAAL